LEAIVFLGGVFTVISLGEFFMLNSTATVYQLFYLPLLRMAAMCAGGILLARASDSRGRKQVAALVLFVLVALSAPLVPFFFTYNRPGIAFFLLLLLSLSALVYGYVASAYAGGRRLSQIVLALRWNR